MFEEKVKTLEELAEIIRNLKSYGKKIVHCHGCFDIVHYGHIRHFINAKEQGDILIVTVTPDRFIQKGPERPFFTEEIRLKHLASIEMINYVALNKWETAVETIKILKPDVYVKGKEVISNKEIDKTCIDSTNVSNLSAEEEVIKSIGGIMHFTEEITFSSSRIINQITDSISDESKIFLTNFRKNFNKDEILETLDDLKKIKVLVIGDSILDEYVYCDSLERSGKEPLVCYKFINKEIHAGGVYAIANHLASFLENLTLITSAGENYRELINNSLYKNIEKKIFLQKGESLVKTRYIDKYKGNKIFEVYNSDELKITKENEDEIMKFLNDNFSEFDMAIIADFGHGMMSPKLIDYFCNNRKFLAVNCQFNGGNLGFNFITKYKRADFVSLNERELRLPFQEKTSKIEIPIVKLSNCLNLDKINLTRGKFGNMYYQRGVFVCVPAFTKQPLDTIGSGDAVFALTSLLAFKDVDSELLSFLGNCIGAIAVKIIGNRNAVDSGELKKFVSYILK